LANIIIDIRKNKLPDWTKIWTAWSFFKNPIISSKEFDKLQIDYPELISFPYYDSSQIKLSSGQLIEMAWLKWLKKWEIWTYPNHALVLVNYGNWTGQEIVNFADNIIDQVKNKFNIILEPEVIYV
jgi:UDP-N-acetylmuramate dehydrogenase